MNDVQLQADLAYLCGPEAAGRLSGSEGAYRAADYLAGALAGLGLRPAGENGGFFQTVAVPAARLTGPVSLAAGGRTYRHRADFGEVAPLSGGGSIHAPLLVVRDEQALAVDSLQGKAILIPDPPPGFDLGATARAAAEVDAAALLVAGGEPAWFYKTVFGSPANRIPVLKVRDSAARAMAAEPGTEVRLELPLTAGTLPCRNVVGLLPSPAPGGGRGAVALVAHYDHLGDDPGGHRFPGAADNASGLATVLAAVRHLLARGASLPFDVVVAFLTGEESGLWGAKHLAANPPVPLSAVINIDVAGVESTLGAVRTGYGAPGNWLADAAAELFKAHGIAVRWIHGGDDSVAFQNAGLPALGLSQLSVGRSPAPLHTPADTLESLHLSAIHELALRTADLIQSLSIKGGYPS